MNQPRKPCENCGGEKQPGKGQRFCRACAARVRHCKKCNSVMEPQNKGRRKSGFYCRSCTVARAKRKREADPDAYRVHLLALKYGVSDDFIRELEAKSGGKCPICGHVPDGLGWHGSSRLNLDHDHATGKPRAFICAPCNQALGLARERPEVFHRMATYLAEHGGKTPRLLDLEPQAWQRISFSPTSLVSMKSLPLWEMSHVS